MAWFLALSMLPLAKATALNMSAALFAVIGAALFLGERGEWRRWAVLLFGFAGVLVEVRPGVGMIGLGVILVLGSRVFTAAQKILAKKLSETERTPTIVAYTALTMSCLTIVPALYVWQTPDLE
jgi:drug/metabolite transporter (DMT)-like permease